MKKSILAVALVLLALLPSIAEERPPLALDMGAGVYYDEIIRPTSDLGEGLSNILGNFRVDYYAAGAYRIIDILTVGAELGVGYMTVTDTAGDSVNFFDLPVNATLTLDLGGISARAFGGMFLYGCFGADNYFVTACDVGARFVLGGLYAEYAYVMDLDGGSFFQRYGIGYCVTLF